MEQIAIWYHGRNLRELASAVRSIREAAGLTQDELAVVLRSSRSTIGRLERAQDVSLDLTARVFRVLGYQLVAVPFGSTVTVQPND